MSVEEVCEDGSVWLADCGVVGRVLQHTPRPVIAFRRDVVETTTEDVNDRAPVEAARAGADDEGFDSYGALVQEAGY